MVKTDKTPYQINQQIMVALLEPQGIFVVQTLRSETSFETFKIKDTFYRYTLFLAEDSMSRLNLKAS